MEKEPWRRDIGNWGRVFYRALSLIEKDPRAGGCWARCESNFRGTVAEQTQFQSVSKFYAGISQKQKAELQAAFDKFSMRILGLRIKTNLGGTESWRFINRV